MSMTADERKAWAHERLTTYLRDVEVGEMLSDFEETLIGYEQDVRDLALGQEEMQRQIDRLDNRVSDLERGGGKHSAG